MARIRHHGEIRLSGIGLLAFTVLVLAVLFWILRPQEHPLAQQRDVPLCDLLDAETWSAIGEPGQAVVVSMLGEGRSICELGTAPEPGARREQSATLARVMMTTEADLRDRDTGNSLGLYVNAFVSEMKTDGWEAQNIEGPWRRTYAFTSPANENALLVEDEGIFLLFSSPTLETDRLREFAIKVTNRLREAG